MSPTDEVLWFFSVSFSTVAVCVCVLIVCGGVWMRRTGMRINIIMEQMNDINRIRSKERGEGCEGIASMYSGGERGVLELL